jgi:hypothetical protein
MRVRRHVYVVAIIRPYVLLFPLTVVMFGCGTPGPPLPPSLELPKPVTNLRASRKGEKVTLTWTVPSRTTDLGKITHLGPTRICRSLRASLNHCNQVGEAPPIFPAATAMGRGKPRTSQGKPPSPVEAAYVDTITSDLAEKNPRAVVNYAVEVMNEDNRSASLSNLVQIPVAPTLAPPPQPDYEVTAEGVTLRWKGTPLGANTPGISYFYRVYRKLAESKIKDVAGEVPLGTSGQAAFTDHGFEWDKTYLYSVTAVTLVEAPEQPMQIEGDDSPTIQITPRDVFPPAVPGGLQAVFSGVGQQPFIDLVWIPDTDSDLAGYNVYRHEDGQPAVKINTDLVRTPAFRDRNVLPGKKYFYAVSAADLRDNESARSEEASEQVP